MRRLVLIATILLAATGCSGHSKQAQSQPSREASHPATPAASASASPAPSAPAASSSAATSTLVLALGATADTVGNAHPYEAAAKASAPLSITPTTVVYVSSTDGNAADDGLFAVVAVKESASTLGAAEVTAPIQGGGFTWIAPDGQATTTLSGNTSLVTPQGFEGGEAPAGAYVWDNATFDIPPSQKGGTLEYVDGAGLTYRWHIPAVDSGPQVSQLEQALAG